MSSMIHERLEYHASEHDVMKRPIQGTDIQEDDQEEGEEERDQATIW